VASKIVIIAILPYIWPAFYSTLAQIATVLHANKERKLHQRFAGFGFMTDQIHLITAFCLIHQHVPRFFCSLKVPLGSLYLSISRPSPSNGAAVHIYRHLLKRSTTAMEYSASWHINIHNIVRAA
jgi:hypothetical protein